MWSLRLRLRLSITGSYNPDKSQNGEDHLNRIRCIYVFKARTKTLHTTATYQLNYEFVILGSACISVSLLACLRPSVCHSVCLYLPVILSVCFAPVCSCICLRSVCPSVCLPDWLLVSVTDGLYVSNTYIRMKLVHISTDCLCVCLCLSLSVYLSFCCLSICWSVRPCVHVSVCRVTLQTSDCLRISYDLTSIIQ